jgi:hypothetical protein
MASFALRLPYGLGLLVRRRTDPVTSVGCVVGLTLRPSLMALVRWRSTGPTFERLEDLVEVHGITL